MLWVLEYICGKEIQMKRLLLGFGFISLIFNQMQAQRFSHQGGLCGMATWETPYRYTAIYPDRPAHEVVTPRDYLWFLGAQYHPSVRFYQSSERNVSASVGLPISTSLFLSASTSQGVSPRNYVFLSLPLQLELNFGAGATPGKGKVGGFVGVGAGLQMFRARSFRYYDDLMRYRQFNSYLSAGLRFGVGGRLVQIAFARAYPFQKRAPLGEVDSTISSESYFPREFLRGTDVVSVSVFLGKKFLLKNASEK
jgi:hypothetical protein